MYPEWRIGADKESEREKVVKKNHVPLPVSKICACRRPLYKADRDNISRCVMCGKLPRVDENKTLYQPRN